jgi:hypothetical protein
MLLLAFRGFSSFVSVFSSIRKMHVLHGTPRSHHCGIFQESLRTELWFETEQHAPPQLFRNRREEPSPDEHRKGGEKLQ